MSVLNRLGLNPHLDDAAFAAIWADASLEGRTASHPHLDACAACRTRFAAFTTWLHDVRSEASAEADEACPPERLAIQHAQIFRRLEAAERPARVIAFPKFARPLVSGTSQVRRWIATAAAAGLIVGLGLGQMMDFRHVTDRAKAGAKTSGSQSTRADRSPERLQPSSATSSDAAFMAEVDASVTHASDTQLQAINAFTPRAAFLDDPQR